MFRRPKLLAASKLRKWCALALMLLVPGSFVAPAALWLARNLAVHLMRQGASR